MEKYNSLIEIAGALSGILGIYLTAREHPSCFPVGLLSVALSFILFRNEGYFANALLQLVFAALLVAGWYQWVRKRQGESLKVTYLNPFQRVTAVVAGVGIGLALGFYFSSLPGSRVPYADGITTGLSIVAQWLVARKKAENWILWIAANILYVTMYLYTGLYLYALLYLVFLIMAVRGWKSWTTRMNRKA